MAKLPFVSGSQRSFRYFFLILLIYYSITSPTDAQLTIKANLTFYEQREAGARVGNVVAASGLPALVAPEDMANLEYTLQSSEHFDINRTRGILTSAEVIDRDILCAGQTECILKAVVLVYNLGSDGSSNLLKIIDVEVHILDINDNPPRFPSKAITLTVPENNALDEELRFSAAEDLDVGENGLHEDSYSFQDPTDTFELKVHTNQGGSQSLGIVIKEKLNREKRDSYQVVVIATDGGQSPRTGSVIINITVTDLNDNEPLFSKSSYNVSVPEDIEINIPIVRIQATDEDIGSNGEISYRISSQVSDDIRRIFYIDEQTGEMFTRTSLDYETDSLYQMYVQAVDHGSSQMSNRVSVTLHVTDVNDNHPQINVNVPSHGISLSELESTGKVVFYVTVSDRDQGENSRVTCSLDDDHFSLEKFDDQGMYKVVLARRLDHEKSSNHRVNITCSDHGQPPLANSTTFVVNVNDENDERPSFEKDTYQGSFPENTMEPMEVVTVIAHDLDSGEMGRITYSIEDRYDGLFRVDPDTGVISVTRPVDRENDAASFEFHAIARDNGKLRLTTTALVVVEVLDENDEAPRFTRPSFYGDVLENQPVGTLVGNVTAIDRDSPANGKIRYAILQQGTDFDKFRIDGNTGEIKSADVFDREEKDRYFFTIQAVDPDNSEYYSTCNFTARILDDNDHFPVITGIRSSMDDVDDGSSSSGGGSSNNITFIVQYTAPIGSAITQVLAHDSDDMSSSNAQLYFDITSGDPDHLFSINRFNGAVALARVVTAKDIKTFKLTITVSDGGDPPKADSKEMYIKVNGSVAALTEASSAGLSQNILIVIILIGVTIVLALAILATICLIRKIDRQRRMNRASQKLSEDKMYQLTVHQTSNHVNHNNHQDVFANRGRLERDDDGRDRRSPGIAPSHSYSNNLSKREGRGGGGGRDGGGTKKEVSFSLDEESDSHNTSSGSAHPLTSFKGGGPHAQTSGDRIDGSKPAGSRPVRNGVMNIPVHGDKGINPRRSPQNEECQLIDILKKSAEDALSESSGETDPSDSGRGGSEDEYSHRGSGLDPEQSNGRYTHPKSNRSSSNVKEKDQQHQRQPQQQHPINNSTGPRSSKLPSAGPSRQLSSSSSTNSTTPIMNGRPRSRLLEQSYQRENPRDSYTSDFGSEFSGSRPPSQSRTDSDRSVPPPPAPRPSRDPPINQMLPFTRPAPISSSSHSHSPSPTLRELQNNHHNMGYTLPSSRSLLTRDSPNRLAGPQDGHIPNDNNSNTYSNSLMRSFQNHRSIPNRQHQQQQQTHNAMLPSLSLERLPRSASSSSTSSHPPPYYSDRAAGGGGFYPSIPERWDRNASSLMTEEDDRTTTSGSYTINTDDLRQDMDEMVLQDSIV